jgi:hypothetical protein
MARYCVNKNAQSTGEHEVHNEDICHELPSPENRQYLGEFSNCRDAVNKARQYYNNCDGCKFCSPACHTR